MRSPGRLVLYAAAGLVALLLVAPTFIVIPMSFSTSSQLEFPPTGFTLDWYGAFFSNPMWVSALIDSVEVALLTVLSATTTGTLLALGLVRGRFPGKSLVTGLVLAPMIVPVVVIAIGMYFVYTRWGIAGTLPGLVAAHTALAMPFVVVTVSTSLRTVDPSLELAAQNLGAGPGRTFFWVTLPLILPGVLAGALFAFATSWDEVVTAIFLTSPYVRTLPIVMWTEIRYEITPTIAAVSTMLMAITSVSLLFVLFIGRRRAT
jgi:putative spermidine/putrescine transport system permease protein